MATCPISQGGAFDCSAKVQTGLYTRLLLYNLDDWKLNTITRDVDGTITGITNATGKQAYDFAVADSGNLIPNSPLRAVDGGVDGFDHQVDSKLYDQSQASFDNVSNMRFTKVVAIVQRNDGRGLLFGEGVGMRLSDLQYLPGDSGTGGLLQFVLKTPDNDPPENELPVVIFDTNEATTTTLLDGLTTPGV
jgi:hypothetical protein